MYDYVAELRALDRKIQKLIDEKFDALEDSIIPPTAVTFIRRWRRTIDRYHAENRDRPRGIVLHPETVRVFLDSAEVRVFTPPSGPYNDHLFGIPLTVSRLAPMGQAILIGAV